MWRQIEMLNDVVRDRLLMEDVMNDVVRDRLLMEDEKIFSLK